ncbi:hypothetical protein BDA96_06G060600 [Sorghum bicolor]|uniref:Uncharacterized protein n=2 Tax=Sorghum bicolor TaxID=4558 RepID=C5YEU6_SORBI|nr:hypothetical protein SORBI_3006G053900 [Sorghum bicolor]KAG0525484.1 hypothetical protein BDA96_06G060600 [Sorghum bicolor]
MEKYVRRSRSSTSLQRRAAEKKKGFLAKTLERCWSLGGGRRRPRWPTTTPPGCFVVLVGPERERFAVRAEGANHPLFRALLDEAEAEYGFPRPAAEPLLLPCAADEFLRVMSEVERDHHHQEDDDDVARGGAAVAGAAAALSSLSPAWSFFLKGGAAARAGFQRMSPGRFLN